MKSNDLFFPISQKRERSYQILSTRTGVHVSAQILNTLYIIKLHGPCKKHSPWKSELNPKSLLFSQEAQTIYLNVLSFSYLLFYNRNIGYSYTYLRSSWRLGERKKNTTTGKQTYRNWHIRWEKKRKKQW